MQFTFVFFIGNIPWLCIKRWHDATALDDEFKE